MQTSERTTAEIRRDIQTYEQARPQLVQDVENARQLAEEERERLIRGAGSLSARSRATADLAAAEAGVQDVDAKLRELRSELEAAEKREAWARERAELAELAGQATEARSRFTSKRSELERRLAEDVPELAALYEEWSNLHSEWDRRAPLGLSSELKEEGHNVSGLGTPERELRPGEDAKPLERAALKLVSEELKRRRRERFNEHVRRQNARRAGRLERTRAEAEKSLPTQTGAEAILRQRAGVE